MTAYKSNKAEIDRQSGNPFIEALHPYINYPDIPAAMMCQPLLDPEVMSHKPADRERYLERLDATFIPTSLTLDVTAGIQLLLRRSLEMRDPKADGQKQFINQIGSVERIEQIAKLPAQSGAGMLISGITGTGKSSVVRRSLEVLCPNQVVEHDSSPSQGWFRLKQCVYLQIDFPSNGARGALLKRILMALDEQLGTTYLKDHKRMTNIDSLLVVVCKQLVLHRVAVITIDEKQEANFLESCWSTDFLNFYLSLMNLGISVVLIGNPLAFKVFHTFAQNIRRFSVGGIFEFQPAKPSDKWWQKDFVPHARLASLVDEWLIDTDQQSALEFELSAGLPGFFMQMQKELMRMALRRGGDKAIVTVEDYTTIKTSARFMYIHRISQELSSAVPLGKSTLIDVPINLRSLKDVEAEAPEPTTGYKPPPDSVESAKRTVRQHAAKQKRELKKLAETMEMIATLPAEDARLQGVSADHVKKLRELGTSTQTRKRR